jgi:hypothetical protein
MKSFLLLPILALTACGASASDGESKFLGGVAQECRLSSQTTTTDPSQCASLGKVPIYSNRFSTACGASSVVSGADAVAGTTPSAGSATPSSPSESPSAMTVSCGEPNCAAGEVAVVDPTAGGAPDRLAPGSPSASAGAGGGAAAGTIRCAAPPPSCASGQSPQYVFSSSTWQCTDCSVVITYGGTYGNYSRCASAPSISCPSGQVPTWVVGDEQWECQDTCDNGQYDQHAVSGSTVCVPC